jgi:hypothetical protein
LKFFLKSIEEKNPLHGFQQTLQPLTAQYYQTGTPLIIDIAIMLVSDVLSGSSFFSLYLSV